MSLSRIVISGTVTSEPEKRFTPNNNVTVTSFMLSAPSLAPARTGQPQEAIPVKVTCWRQMADVVAEQIHQNDEVLIEGKLIINAYQSPDGAQKKMFEIEAAAISKIPGSPQPLLIPVGVPSSSSEGKQPAYAAHQDFAPAREFSGNSGISTQDFYNTEDDIPF